MEEIPLYQTPLHTCGYYHDRQASNHFINPTHPLSSSLYGQLMALGFRRSGEQIYRPACPGCNACLSARLPVACFRANRSQRRTWRANGEVELRIRPAGFIPEHYQLYLHYQTSRHPGGGMDEDDPGKYLAFLTASWCDTRFLELRQDGRLLAVAVTDITPLGLSAVYTFYHPQLSKRGLGTLSILHQIALAHRLKLPYLYLGYWIENHPKMGYKSRFQPLEIYRDQRWERLEGTKQRTPGPAASANSA